MAGIMAFAVRQGRHPQGAFEVTNKTAVVIKSAVDGDIRNGFIRILQAVAGNQHPQPDQILPWTRPKCLGKAPF